MTAKIDTIKEKLRKILAIVKSNGNEFERNMAMQRLQEMLVKHRLELSDIEEKQKEDIVRVEVIGRNGPWARSVCQAIAKLNFCNYIFVRTGPSNDQRLVRHCFIGRPHEVEVAKELAMLIIDQLWTESASQARKNGDPSFQRSFLNAASYAIYYRAEDLIKQSSSQTDTQSQSTALMVLNAYEQAKNENNQFIAISFGPIKMSKSKTRSKSYAGSVEGKAFGNKIPLNVTKKLA